MPTKISPQPRQQFLDTNGNPYAGAKLFTYAAGSTTKLPTFTDSAGGTPNANPILLDAAGRTPFGLWLTEGKTYKLVLAPSTDTDPPTSPIFTEDGIAGINDTGTTTSQWIASGSTPVYVSPTQFTLVGDKTSDFHVGRRVKFTVTAGTVYGRISVTAYTTLTTVTIVGGALDSGLSAVELSALTAVNHAIPVLVDADMRAIGIQPLDATTTALAGLATGADTLPYFTGTDAAAQTPFTAFARTVLDDASQAVALTTLGAPLNATVALTGAYAVVAADRGKLFDCSGTFILAPVVAATIGNSTFGVRNSGTGVITFTPTSPELVDGVASITFTAGESALVTCNGTAFKTVGRITPPPVIHVRDEKAAGTPGGASVAGNQTRTLNTVVKNTITGASLSANDITLPTGVYHIHASAMAIQCLRHRLRLFNVTDATVTLLGSNEFSNTGDGVVSTSVVLGEFTLTAAKTFRLIHYTQSALATNGLGLEVSDTFLEVYANAFIKRVG